MSYNSIRLPQDLPIYYKNFFPVKPFTKWLKYGLSYSDYFNRREFAFILPEDVHIRYRSYNDEHSFFKALTSTNPEKLDIGAIYNHEPVNNKRHTDYQAVERELVFDIDLTDYDPIRNCCKEATVCPKCWKFMVLAVKILDFQLEDMFDFKARMWVFSGRRGVHCWVGDKKARMLNNSARSAIATRLNLFKKNGQVEVTEGRQKLTRVPPFVMDAFKVALKDGIFEEMVYEQGWLDDEKFFTDFPQASESFLAQMKSLLGKFETPKERWHLLRALFDDDYRQNLSDKDGLIDESQSIQGRDRYFLMHFVLQRCYPRLDVNVSTGTNHLLKSPFCIHPKTGNVAVPLNVEQISEFDVSKCPRIDRVVGELESLLAGRENDENEDSKNRKFLAYKHGTLAPYVENLEKFAYLASIS
uniref:DNA primase n=1 Tax=Caenorhabditis japonica TaxID=281687 RepID=A0A8R1I1T6_CAEJA